MKRLMLFLFIAAFCIPQNGQAQYISWDNMTVWAGGAYSTVYGTGGMHYSKFNVRPHARISYTLPLTELFHAAVFSGYSPWGGKNQSSNQRRTITLHTLSVGAKMFYKNPVVSMGPVFSWNRIVSSRIEIVYNSDARTDRGSFEKFLSDQMYNLGIVLQREIGGGIKVSFEGLYGLNDIFIHEDRRNELVGLGNIKWYPRQYRLSIGYSF